MSNPESCNQIKKTLEAAGCCPRCILRHLGGGNYYNYIEKETVLKEISLKCGLDTTNGSAKSEALQDPYQQDITDEANCENNVPPSKRHHASPCTCCLGVLQSGCDPTTIESIIEAVKSNSYEFKDFVLQLSMPPSVELREKLMQIHLKGTHGCIYSDLQVPIVRDVWKWAVGPPIGKFFKVDFTPKSSFAISVKMSHPDVEKECQPLNSTGFFNNFNGKKTVEEIYTRSSVSKAIYKKQEALKLLYVLPPPVALSEVKVDQIGCFHQPIYLAGRYNKYSRVLSQTPWVVDGEKRMASSVEEEIVKVVLKYLVVDKIVFSSSGREDVDVRMLGKGRPFVLELVNPKSAVLSKELLKSIQESINSNTKDVAVTYFQVVSKDDLQYLKKGEEEKRKQYLALCCINRPITDVDIAKIAQLTNIELLQKTPIRVLHRRTQSVRKRLIYTMSLDKKDDSTFLLHVETQAGTYVKEFVHGDFGRTKPCLKELLNAEIDILELDVENVELDWPPPL